MISFVTLLLFQRDYRNYTHKPGQMKNKTKENKRVIQENKEFKLFAFQSHPEAKYTFVTGIFCFWESAAFGIIIPIKA